MGRRPSVSLSRVVLCGAEDTAGFKPHSRSRTSRVAGGQSPAVLKEPSQAEPARGEGRPQDRPDRLDASTTSERLCAERAQSQRERLEWDGTWSIRLGE